MKSKSEAESRIELAKKELPALIEIATNSFEALITSKTWIYRVCIREQLILRKAQNGTWQPVASDRHTYNPIEEQKNANCFYELHINNIDKKVANGSCQVDQKLLLNSQYSLSPFLNDLLNLESQITYYLILSECLSRSANKNGTDEYGGPSLANILLSNDDTLSPKDKLECNNAFSHMQASIKSAIEKRMLELQYSLIQQTFPEKSLPRFFPKSFQGKSNEEICTALISMLGKHLSDPSQNQQSAHDRKTNSSAEQSTLSELNTRILEKLKGIFSVHRPGVHHDDTFYQSIINKALTSSALTDTNEYTTLSKLQMFEEHLNRTYPEGVCERATLSTAPTQWLAQNSTYLDQGAISTINSDIDNLFLPSIDYPYSQQERWLTNFSIYNLSYVAYCNEIQQFEQLTALNAASDIRQVIMNTFREGMKNGLTQPSALESPARLYAVTEDQTGYKFATDALWHIRQSLQGDTFESETYVKATIGRFVVNKTNEQVKYYAALAIAALGIGIFIASVVLACSSGGLLSPLSVFGIALSAKFITVALGVVAGAAMVYVGNKVHGGHGFFSGSEQFQYNNFVDKCEKDTILSALSPKPSCF